MADPRLHGNGETCPTCAGSGRVWIEANAPGDRWARCPAGCRRGRLAFTPTEIVARMIAEARQASA